MYLDPSIKQTWDWGGIQNSQGVLALGVLAINLPGKEGGGRGKMGWSSHCHCPTPRSDMS